MIKLAFVLWKYVQDNRNENNRNCVNNINNNNTKNKI